MGQDVTIKKSRNAIKGAVCRTVLIKDMGYFGQLPGELHPELRFEFIDWSRFPRSFENRVSLPRYICAIHEQVTNNSSV